METSPDRVVDGFTELLDGVGSKEIATQHRVGIHSNRIDFEEHAKIGAFLGIHDPKTLDDLDQQTDVRDGLEPISQGHFSWLTNRRPWEAFADLANAILQPKREMVNEFIRTREFFDGVIDFDTAIQDPDQPDRILPKYDSGGHLHASNAAMSVGSIDRFTVIFTVKLRRLRAGRIASRSIDASIG